MKKRNIILLLSFFISLYYGYNSYQNADSLNIKWRECKVIDKATTMVISGGGKTSYSGYEKFIIKLYFFKENKTIEKTVDVWTYNKYKKDDVLKMKLSNEDVEIEENEFALPCFISFIIFFFLSFWKLTSY